MSEKITPDEMFAKLAEIQKLLDEGLEHYLTYESHCKSSEGYVSLDFGNSWTRREGKTDYRVHVYSYALGGPDRSYDFDNIDEALETVRQWHAEEMAFVPESDYQEKANKAASEFLEGLMDKITIVEINVEDKDEDE